jgi:hypothetical protein
VLTYTVSNDNANTNQAFVTAAVACEAGDLMMTGGCYSAGPPDTAQAVYLLTTLPVTDGANGWSCTWHKPTSWGYGFSAYAVCIDME